MLFVLPPKDVASSAWLPRQVLAAAAELPSERVSLALPRFKVEMADSLRLKPVLIELGMPLAFERARADFTGIANPRNPEDRLSIDEVYHKAFVRVDEKGTEAAAATAVVMKRAGARAIPARPVSFDRPFAFVLRHVPSGTPLFVGKVADPAAGTGS
jgi:serpin B